MRSIKPEPQRVNRFTNAVIRMKETLMNTLTRRGFGPGRAGLIWTIAGLALAPMLAHAQETPVGNPGPRPNIIMILGDDHGYPFYGFMGHPHIQMPHMDRLAREGRVYTRGYVTTPLCCPSLATTLTGMYPHQHGFTGNDPVPPAEMRNKKGKAKDELKTPFIEHFRALPQLPRELANAGYLTMHTGKYWYGKPENSGFTDMMKGNAGRHGGDYLDIGRKTMQPIYDFIAKARHEERPFFVWYAPFLPHTPHDPPQRLLDKYVDKALDLNQAKYWAMCEWFDETVGDLVGHLEKCGLRKNTLVIYQSDNGWPKGKAECEAVGFRGGKLSPWELGVRQPIVINQPGRIEPLRDETHLASNIDLAPTILAACDLPVPKEMEGVNLLDRQAVEKRDAIFLEHFEHDMRDLHAPEKSLESRTVISGKWKFIAFHKPGHTDALFDLDADPKEATDLSTKSPEIVREMRAKLDAWWIPSEREPK
jgi:arylsulfatase A-like enzyme